MDDDAIRGFRTQMQLLQRRLRREVPPVLGLSRSAMQVLGAVGRASKTSPRLVADEVRMTSSNVASALRELEGASLIQRHRNPDDARGVLLTVTDAGAEVAEEFRHERDTWLGRAVEMVLDDDERQVLIAAGRLMQRLAEFE